MYKKAIFTFLCVTLLFALTGAAWSAGTKKVAILPFKVNAEKDLAFLREGIVDMLTTRLSYGDEVAVIEREAIDRVMGSIPGPINQKMAEDVGSALGADYVLFGSLTVIGESVSIDAKMIDLAGAMTPLTFFNQSQGMDPVIPKVNDFATEINRKVFARELPVQEAPSRTAAAGAAQAPGQPSQDIYAHPEKLMGQGPQGGAMETSGLNPYFVVTPGGQARGAFWKSQNFKEVIKGLSLGDVDGDGNQEIVFISNNTVFVYRNVQRRFIKVKEIPGQGNYNFLGVDVADVNGNGRAEIFVTNLLATGGTTLGSFVLEWENGDFVFLAQHDKWYFRVVELPHRGTVLVGQKRGSVDPFIGGIHELGWRDGQYEPVAPLEVPANVDIFGFSVGDVLDNGTDMIVAFDDDDFLQIFNQAGSREWKSSERFGGSESYMTLKPSEVASDEGTEANLGKELLYLPQRIFIKDINRDGKHEVLVVQNQAVTARMLSRFRHFTSSELVSLSWNGLGLGENWRTKKIDGYVSDFYIGDFDNDGKEELVAVVVISRKAAFVAKAKSAIISYDLEVPVARPDGPEAQS